MEGKAKAVLVLVAVLFVGAIAGYFAATLKFPRSDHRWVAQNISIKDKDWNVVFTLECTKVTKAKVGLATFPLEEGKTYPRSEWMARRDGDIEVYVSIWGPGEDGGIFVEVAKLAGNEFEVTFVPDGQTWTLPKVTTEPAPAYISFVVYVTS